MFSGGAWVGTDVEGCADVEVFDGLLGRLRWYRRLRGGRWYRFGRWYRADS
jgi:hypothetical protein